MWRREAGGLGEFVVQVDLGKAERGWTEIYYGR